jgi:vacuolar-type H+-ATPase subunit E/Vma4
MEKIIEEILSAENNVNQILQDAREKALAIKKNIDDEVSEKTGAAREQAKQIIHNAIERAKTDTIKRRDERLAHAEEQDRAFLTAKRREIGSLVDVITRQIISIELDER